MPITNLNSQHLAASDITNIQTTLGALEESLASVNANLTPDERQKYGSINEQNKLFVNKVNDYRKDSPGLAVPDVDWVEFGKDYDSRIAFENLIARLDALSTKLKNAKTLYDYDNYQAALADYAYTSYRAGTGADGFETKYNELKQFFGKTSKTSPPTP